MRVSGPQLQWLIQKSLQKWMHAREKSGVSFGGNLPAFGAKWTLRNLDTKHNKVPDKWGEKNPTLVLAYWNVDSQFKGPFNMPQNGDAN